MKIDYEFTVSTPIERAWNTMLDLEKIAPCLPGAAIQEEKGDGAYAGTIKVKIGPITASYMGTVGFEEADEANHRAVLHATGRDARGQGTASATIVSTLHELGDNTRVNVETDMQLTGRAAQFGRGLAQDVATKMLDQFAACLEQEISGVGGATTKKQVPPTAEAGGMAGGAIGSENPDEAAGGTVEGAVIAGSSPSEAAAGVPTTPIQQSATQVVPRREPTEESGAIDLGPASRGEILERLTPVLAGAGLLLVVLFWLFRRRS